MRLHDKNTYIAKHKEKFSVFIELPNESRNYLHSEGYDLESAIIVLDLIRGKNIDYMNLKIKEDETYYRIFVNIEDDNRELHVFHSRKLNLNDALYERDLLIEQID